MERGRKVVVRISFDIERINLIRRNKDGIS